MDLDSYKGECACPVIADGTVLYDEEEPASGTRSPIAASIEGTHLGSNVSAFGLLLAVL